MDYAHVAKASAEVRAEIRGRLDQPELLGRLLAQCVVTEQLCEDAAAAQALATAPMWLVWSNVHAAWWGPNRQQYFWRIEAAGRYTLEEAMGIAATRLVARGDGINPPEVIQPAPEWLALREAIIAKANGQ